MNLKAEHQDKTLRLRGDRDHLRVIVENLILGSLECIPLTDIPDESDDFVISWTANGKEVTVLMENPWRRSKKIAAKRSRAVRV